jgi:mannose-6-phosphate isomerase-like protein (cupin superfamily)
MILHMKLHQILKSVAFVALMSGGAMLGQQTPFPSLTGFVRWSSDDLKSINGRLATRPTPPGSSPMERLGDSGSLRVFMERRSPGDYVPEAHTVIDDLLIIQDGSGTLIYGGAIEGGKETTAGQIRGGHIVGGTMVDLKPGDVIYIPAGMPHQLTVPSGGSLYILVTKTPSSKQKNQ